MNEIKKQDDLDKYLDYIVDFMDQMKNGPCTSMDIEKSIPHKPAFLSDDDEISIKNIIYDCDIFPNTFNKFIKIFSSHPNYDDLHYELNNDNNWID